MAFTILADFFSIVDFICLCDPIPIRRGLTGGYSNTQLDKDIYKISFRGNGFTSLEKVQDLLLYRCAELTESKGYKYFAILNSNTSHKDASFSMPDTVSSQSFRNFDNSYNTFSTINHGQSFESSKYRQDVIIKMLRNKNKFSNAFSAYYVKKNLGQKMKMIV